MKYAVLVGFLAIFASLGTALVFMLRGGREGRPASSGMAWALAVRVGLSILLFLCLLLAWKLGWIQPTGLPASGR
ncbi:twin transmembrane helix small protein [Xylophilus sp.]|uniref:twin transmembrane helix small protein n=1 Tax=Xylophilus sp. TaxID=2653893 RepID=UPI002D7FC37E|nr:twin transmembrane helix small protein [Xylophilus sp.]